MNILKQKAVAFFERGMAKTADILDVRHWHNRTLVEADLHIPDANMHKWDAVQHIKVKVAEYTYRDYTPALWDADTRTCTLFIDAGHSGPGSAWARSLSPGDRLTYLGIGPTPHKPVPGVGVYCLGDSSTIGHFLALEQLAEGKSPVHGALCLTNGRHQAEFSQYFRTALQPVNGESYHSLRAWLTEHPVSGGTVYIAGHIPTVIQLRKYIKRLDGFKGTVKAQGFWD